MKGGGRDVKWAAFLDDQRVATASGDGKLAVWNVRSAQPLYHLKMQGACRPALSPDRKYLAYTTGKSIGILDTDKGEVLATATTVQMNFPVLCFSPGGSRLACAAFNKLHAWDFADGTLYRELPLKDIHVGEKLLFCSEKHVLVAGRYLFDVENQVKLWDYQGHELVESAGSDCWFVVHDGADSPGALVSARLPQPGVEEKLEQAMTEPDFFVLKPGTMVKLNVEDVAGDEEREKVKTSLTTKLQERGFKVGVQGRIELIASTQEGEKREITYRMFGMGFGYKTCKVREYFSRLKFVYQDETAWEAKSSNVPGFIHLKKDEKLEKVLKRHEKPPYAYFEQVELPKLLMKPTDTGTLGQSRLTVAGLQ